jgi:hypothetical protein
VIAPSLGAEVEELSDFAGLRINRTEVSSLVAVTVKTRVGKILCPYRATVFPGSDVIDFVRIGVQLSVVRSLAVFAPPLSTFDGFNT